MNLRLSDPWPLPFGLLAALVVVALILLAYRRLRGATDRRSRFTFTALRLAAGLLLWWAYAPVAGGWVRSVCAAAKLCAVVLLLFCLLEPMWTQQRVRPGANLFAMLADNSESLQVRDAGNASTRGEELLGLLASEPDGWQAALEAEFGLRRDMFDTRLRSSRDFREL